MREKPALKKTAAGWFHSNFGIPIEVYSECMEAFLNEQSEYGWFLCLDGSKIIGGMGVVEKDLFPNVCAVFTEKEYHRKGICRAVFLLKQIYQVLVKSVFLRGT